MLTYQKLSSLLKSYGALRMTKYLVVKLRLYFKMYFICFNAYFLHHNKTYNMNQKKLLLFIA